MAAQSCLLSALVSPTTFFEFAIHGAPLWHVSLEQPADKVSKTTETSSQSMGEGDFGNKGSCSHRIIPRCTCHGSDFTCHGSGDESIYAEQFGYGDFLLKHTGPGIIFKVNAGPNTNVSLIFYVNCQDWMGGWLAYSIWLKDLQECHPSHWALRVSENGKISKKVAWPAADSYHTSGFCFTSATRSLPL